MNKNYKGYQPVATLIRTSQETKDKVIKMYLNGSSQTQIEKTLQMTRKTIRTILKEAGIDRTKSQQWRLRHGHTLDETVFDLDKLTPEAKYWIGFLYADGHISDGVREKCIEVSVHTQDREHLVKFLNFLKSNKKVSDSKNVKMTRVRFGSDRIHKALREFGFDNRKSYTATPSEYLKNSRDFWRGVVDGDGSVSYVSTRDYQILHLCGTKDTISEFIEFIKRNGIETTAIPRLANKREKFPLYQVSFATKKAIRVANLLYKDSTIYLERKYQSFIEKYNDDYTNAA